MTRIQPLSVLLGLALAGLCFLTMSQSVVAGNPLRVEYMAHPRDMVQIREGAPFVVPTARLFVLTGLGTSVEYTGGNQVQLYVNGQEEVSVRLSSYGSGVENSPSSSDIVPVPPGLTAGAGSIITIAGAGSSLTDARAWGYLSNL